MAQTEHLPTLRYPLSRYSGQVYKAASPRYGLWPTRGNRPPCTLSSEPERAYRRVGQDLRDGARRVLKLVVRANARYDKAPVLRAIREEVEEPLDTAFGLLGAVGDRGLRVAWSAYRGVEHGIRLVADIARQNEGWLKSQRQGHVPIGGGQNRRATTPQPPPWQGGDEGEVTEPSVP